MYELRRYPPMVMFAVLLLFAVIMLRTAWVGDDAAITLRTVLNFVHGHGATFNIDERVQAYTHPLWFLALSLLTWLTNNVMVSVYGLSLLCSLIAVFLILRYLPTSLAGGLLAVATLLFSKAYIDYAASGLENPLSHVLLVLIVLAAQGLQRDGCRSQLLGVLLSASLLFLNRPDLLLLCLPLVIHCLAGWRQRWREAVPCLVLAGLPVVAWLLFATWYYGFPWPNTAYAKLGAGVDLPERLTQGFLYLLDSLARDPLTLVAISLGLFVGWRGASLDRCLAIGAVLYLLYILYIGGDFMSGRFLVAPLLIAAMILARQPWSLPQLAAPVTLLALLAINGMHATLLSGSDYAQSEIRGTGIADERGFYFQQHGLLSLRRNGLELGEWAVGERSVDVVCGGLGYTGLLLGPGAHLIDNCGLADPLLARLPASYDPDWRIGHFIRQLPEGYRQSVVEDANLINEPTAALYYESLRRVTRGELTDLGRLREIVRLNAGIVPKPDWHFYRYLQAEGGVLVPLERLLQPVQPGVAWDAPSNQIFSRQLNVLLPEPTSIRGLEVTLDHNDHYRIDYFHNGSYRPLVDIRPVPGWGLHRHVIRLEEPSEMTTRLRITAVSGDGLYALGHLILE